MKKEIIECELLTNTIKIIEERILILQRLYKRIQESEENNIKNEMFIKGYLQAYQDLIINLSKEKNILIENYKSQIDIYV